jgi:hypothetical protein
MEWAADTIRRAEAHVPEGHFPVTVLNAEQMAGQCR